MFLKEKQVNVSQNIVKNKSGVIMRINSIYYNGITDSVHFRAAKKQPQINISKAEINKADEFIPLFKKMSELPKYYRKEMGATGAIVGFGISTLIDNSSALFTGLPVAFITGLGTYLASKCISKHLICKNEMPEMPQTDPVDW